MKTHTAKGCRRIRDLATAKWGIVTAAIVLLAGATRAQDQVVPAMRVAHPWDPSTPLDPAVVSADDPPLVAGTWTALGPAPIANGQRPGGGAVSGRITG